MSLLISLSCQASYLDAVTFDANKDLLFIVNIVLLVGKLLFFCAEYYFKSTLLHTASTEVEEEAQEEETDVEGTIEMTDNPMSFAKDSELRPIFEKRVDGLQKEKFRLNTALLAMSGSNTTPAEQQGQDNVPRVEE